VDAIVDPYPHYQRLRDLGPVVWLTKHRVYALPRYAECKAALLDDKTFLSGRGVALNPIANRMSRGTTLNSDGVEQDQRRKLVAHWLLPRALRAISDSVDETAAAVGCRSRARQGRDRRRPRRFGRKAAGRHAGSGASHGTVADTQWVIISSWSLRCRCLGGWAKVS